MILRTQALETSRSESTGRPDMMVVLRGRRSLSFCHEHGTRCCHDLGTTVRLPDYLGACGVVRQVAGSAGRWRRQDSPSTMSSRLLEARRSTADWARRGALMSVTHSSGVRSEVTMVAFLRCRATAGTVNEIAIFVRAGQAGCDVGRSDSSSRGAPESSHCGECSTVSRRQRARPIWRQR